MPTRQKLRAHFFWLALGYAGLVLVLAWQLKREHDLALASAGDHADNLVQILDGQFNSTLRRIETDLHQIGRQVPRAALKREARWRYQVHMLELLQSYQENFPELANFFVWDREGRVLYSTTPLEGEADATSIAMRPGYQTLRDDPTARIAFSELIRGFLTKRMTLVVYVPLRDEEGRLIGVVNASLNIEHIRKWFQGMNLSPGSNLFVRNSQNHKLMLREPWGNDDNFNKPVRNRLQERIDAGETAGRDRFVAVLDGTPRIYAFRKLQRYPFYVVVGMSEDDALKRWRSEVIFVTVVVLLLAVLLGFLLLRMRAIQSERAAAQRQADEALALLRDALDSISVGIVIYDAQDRLVMANRAITHLYSDIQGLVMQPGMTFEEIIRSGFELKLFPDAVGREEEWLAERMEARRQTQGEAREHCLSDGRWVQYSEHRTSQGYMVGSRIDITDRKRMENDLREQASTDALTALANRRYFMQSLEGELERVRRQTTQRACVLMLDLDHFKRVNDQYGHAAGDALLRHFADLMRSQLRGTDMAGRLGGEEFAVILPGSGPDEARIWAQRLCDTLAAQPLAWDAGVIRVTVSAGIAVLGPNDSAASTVLSRADMALYRAKENGRNRVELA